VWDYFTSLVFFEKEKLTTESMTTVKKYTFYTYPNNNRVFKSLIAAKYGGIFDDFGEVHIQFGVDNKKEDFLKMNPFGKVPVLNTPDGSIFESDAIARYVCKVGKASEQLLGKTPFEQSLVDRWIDVLNFTVLPHLYSTFSFAFGFGPKFHHDTVKHALKEIGHNCFDEIEKQFKLTGHKFLVGDSVTLVDIIYAVTLNTPLQVSMDKEYREKYPNTFQWIDNCLNQDHFKSVMGERKPWADKFDHTKHEQK